MRGETAFKVRKFSEIPALLELNSPFYPDDGQSDSYSFAGSPTRPATAAIFRHDLYSAD
jgi:hypothetical protein